MVPYVDNGHLTCRQKNYNFCLSSCRMSVERAIGLLKGRWRSLLHHLAMGCVERISYHFLACCVLHMFNEKKRNRSSYRKYRHSTPLTTNTRYRAKQR
ncbi:hypothetical protein EAI_17018 [Harpegnathos saltator]|uniref:DDE Tnp4 domain-containing protein n=1 Tax=Harpegnathos saltator TaxID=610380 RepID=E2C894_HARSA|nr:hypothetical protein EAI_17018 [Harpegnathos saltator]